MTFRVVLSVRRPCRNTAHSTVAHYVVKKKKSTEQQSPISCFVKVLFCLRAALRERRSVQTIAQQGRTPASLTKTTLPSGSITP